MPAANWRSSGTRRPYQPCRAYWGTRSYRTWPVTPWSRYLDPSVDDALRDALGKLKGRLLVGVIGSLGVRRDGRAVEPLSKMLANPDAVVARAAARALGKIGTLESGKVLSQRLKNAPDEPATRRCRWVPCVCRGVCGFGESYRGAGAVRDRRPSRPAQALSYGRHAWKAKGRTVGLRPCRPTSVIAQFDAIWRTILLGAAAPHWLRPCRPTGAGGVLRHRHATHGCAPSYPAEATRRPSGENATTGCSVRV